MLVALDKAVVCHHLWAAAEHYRLDCDGRPCFEKLDDFALAFVNVVKADVHGPLKLGDLICQGGETAQQASESDAVEVRRPGCEGKEFFRDSIEERFVVSLHLIAGVIGKWCSVTSELFGEALGLLCRADKGVVVLCQRRDRFARSFG